MRPFRDQTAGHVLLVGFMGSGKSTIAPLLARQLCLPYRELDQQVEERYGLPIRQIFTLYGEESFRRSEGWELARLLMDPPAVIALGGGAFHKVARKRIPASVSAVWLEVGLDLAWQRCRADFSRPLADDFERFRGLYLERRQDYRQAQFRVGVDGKAPRDIVAEVVTLLKS